MLRTFTHVEYSRVSWKTKIKYTKMPKKFLKNDELQGTFNLDLTGRLQTSWIGLIGWLRINWHICGLIG